MSIDDLIMTQPHACNILRGFAENFNKMPHSMLFFGPKGSGKSHYANYFAHDALCLDKKEKRACKGCISCESWEKNAHPDIYWFSEEKGFSMGIDTVKKIQEVAQWKPVYSDKKIIIIDDLHCFTNEAFNCFLKTLEEPSLSTYFILTASQIDIIPSTILSRTVRIPFHRLSAKKMNDIMNILSKNPQEKEFILSVSQGNIKQALQYCEEEYLQEAMQWIEKWIDFMQDPSGSFPSLSSKNLEQCLHWCKWIIREKYSMKLIPSKGSILYENKKICQWLKKEININSLFVMQEALIHLEMELKKSRIQPKSNLDFWMMKSKQEAAQ